MELWLAICMILYFMFALIPLFGQVPVLIVMIRSKLILESSNANLIIGMISGDFLICCAILWQGALIFIDSPTGDPFFTKGQCLLMEAPNIGGMVISQIFTLSLAVDRMNALRDPIAYYKRQHKEPFKTALYWWSAGGILAVATAIMPHIANDVSTVIHYTDPTWPTWFRDYWMILSIIVSALVLLAYLLVIFFSRKKSGTLTDNENNWAKERRIAREKLITKTVMSVLVVYILFWGLPSLVYNVGVIFDVNLGSTFGLLMMFGSVLCSCGNIAILLMKQDIRAEVKSLQVVVLIATIRSKLIRESGSAYLIIGIISGDFLVCCSVLWQGALLFIDSPTGDLFLTKGQCLLMEAPNFLGVVFSQIATLSLAVDRMNTFRDPVGYYKKEHFQSALYWLSAGGILALATAAMPHIANDTSTVIHCTDPTWPTWFRRYWLGFSIIVSALVLLVYLLVIIFSRKKSGTVGEVEDRRRNERRITREKMVTKTVVRVLLVYILFWGLPSVVYNVVVTFDANLGSRFGLLMMFGSVLCSCGNIAILLMRKDMRAEVKLVLGCCCCQQQGSHSMIAPAPQNAAADATRIDP
uniref:G-protein coupled receptors family 1 profile domain-containing protein n=1 Tax=Plectus sambesii TaxID=2011161 RepID=A0A914VTY5_9BILA